MYRLRRNSSAPSEPRLPDGPARGVAVVAGRRSPGPTRRGRPAPAGRTSVGFEPAADGQDRVAHRLGLEPADRHPAEQAVLRVDGVERGRRGATTGGRPSRSRSAGAAASASSRRARTRRPASRAARGGVGRSPRAPKSPGVVDQPPAEMVQPDAVDQHPGHQRVLAAGQVPGIGQPPAGRRQCRVIDRDRRASPVDGGQHRQLARRDGLLRLLGVAAGEQVRRRGPARGPRSGPATESSAGRPFWASPVSLGELAWSIALNALGVVEADVPRA